MGRTHATLKGGRQLEKELARLRDAGPAVADDALDEWAQLVRTGARSNVPVDTGRLRDAIEAHRPSASEAQVGVWDPEAYYVQFVENGTSSQPAQPFLGPAFDRGRRAVARLVRESLARRVGR